MERTAAGRRLDVRDVPVAAPVRLLLGIPFRVDAGIIPSPVGLFTLQLQPHRNPLVNAPFYYFTPLPAVNSSPERVRLILGVGLTHGAYGARTTSGSDRLSPAHPATVLNLEGEIRDRPYACERRMDSGSFRHILG
jgi:hypothetical protein